MTRSAAQLAAAQKRQKFDIPENVRVLQRAYNKAQREGREPSEQERDGHRQYEHYRWGQLPPEVREVEQGRSNATRKARVRIWGKPPVTPRQRAVVQLIRKHRREFERLLEAEEAREHGEENVVVETP